MPQRTGAFLFFGLANASVSGIYLSPNKKFGATFDAGQTFLAPYFKINGTRGAEYSPIPFAGGLGGTLSYKFSDGMFLKVMGDYGTDRIGIRNSSPSYDGYYNSKTKNYFGNVKFTAPARIAKLS